MSAALVVIQQTLPLARLSDPLTAKHAAASVGNGLEPLILACLSQYGDQTKDEIAARIPNAYPPSITTAISRLRKDGFVEDSGCRRLSARRREATVWRLV